MAPLTDFEPPGVLLYYFVAEMSADRPTARVN